MDELFKAQVACRVAKISARTLDYWVTTGLVDPHSTYQSKAARRDFFLFSFHELLQLRVIAALRASGISLQRIRDVVAKLRELRGESWQKAWLITQGKTVYVAHDPRTLEELGAASPGQLSFAAIAIEFAEHDVRHRLQVLEAQPMDFSRLEGAVTKFKRVA